jgi:hypothetical protein
MRIVVEALIIAALVAAYVFFLFATPDLPWAGALLLGAIVGTVIIALALAMIHGIPSAYTRRKHALLKTRYGYPDLRDGGVTRFRRIIDHK